MERLCTDVRAHVTLALVVAREPPTADVAAIRSLTSVDAYVHAVLVPVAERLVTVLTRVRPHTAVVAFVHVQTLGVHEGLVALVALEGGVLLHVRLEVFDECLSVGEPPVADAAEARHQVLPAVRHQRVLVLELPLADAALDAVRVGVVGLPGLRGLDGPGRLGRF